MFDVQMEFGILRDRLNDCLVLECLDGEELASAYVDLGYLNCILEYKIMPDSEVYESLMQAIEAYEEASC